MTRDTIRHLLPRAAFNVHILWFVYFYMSNALDFIELLGNIAYQVGWQPQFNSQPKSDRFIIEYFCLPNAHQSTARLWPLDCMISGAANEKLKIELEIDMVWFRRI